VPAPSAPPVWPPVAAEANPPSVPENLASALDMTAEIPRVRPGAAPDAPAADHAPTGHGHAPTGHAPDDHVAAEQPTAARSADTARQAAVSQAAAAQRTAAEQADAARRAAAETQARISDQTMELPIFRELESAWFRTARSGDDGAKAGAVPNGATGEVTAQRFSTAEPAPSAVPQQGGPSVAGNTKVAEMSHSSGENPPTSRNTAPAGGWRTAADEGWQAARAASEAPAAGDTTTAGLPKRTPMAQLVPGGIDRGGPSVQRRTPEAVRGLLSAYHRGVQRGRSKDQSTAPEDSPGGQSSQAGKEHDA
jgi:hypothetical protein